MNEFNAMEEIERLKQKALDHDLMILATSVENKVLGRLIGSLADNQGMATVNGKPVELYIRDTVDSELRKWLAELADLDPNKASALARLLEQRKREADQENDPPG